MAFPGTYVNGPTLGVTGLAVGDPDTAVSFDPAGDEYAVSDDTFPQQTLTAFTIGGIIKPGVSGASVNFWGIDGNFVELDLRTQFDDSFGVAFVPGGGFSGTASFRGATIFSVGSTYRIIATWDGSVVKLYVNGAVDGMTLTGGGVASYSNGGVGGTAPFDSAMIIAAGGTAWVLDEDLNFYAATDQFDITGNFSLDGTLDELFFKANYAATALEVTAIDDAATGSGDIETAINALSPDVYWRLGESSGTVVNDSANAAPVVPPEFPTPALEAQFYSTEDLTPYGRDGATIIRGTTSPSIAGYVSDAGTYSTTLDNITRSFDPNYAAGPFYPDVVPGVPIRAIINWDSVDYPLFAGTADGWPQSYPLNGQDQLIDFRGTDAFAFFAGASAEITRPAELTGARIQAVLSALDYPGVTDIAPGSSFVPALNRGTAVSLSHLADVAQTEWGELYVAGDLDGTFTFRGRNEIATAARSSVSQATFVQQDPNNPYDGLQYSDLTMGSPPIVNEVVISYSDSGKQITLRDDASVMEPWSNGVPKSLPLSLPMMTGSQARSYARWLLLLYAYPITTFTSITLTPANAPGATFDLWEQALSRELGDRITVVVDPLHLSATPPNRPELSGAPITRDVVIRGIQHDFGQQPYSTTFYLQDQTWMDNLFIMDTSELDGPDIMGM